jgi:alpha-L-arabinofuranosidase
VHHVADLGPFGLLDATATCDPDGRALTVAVVNRDRDQAHAATIEVAGAEAQPGGEVAEVNGPDVGAANSFDHPDRVGVTERRLAKGVRRIEHAFPAHSITVLRLRLG